MAQNNLPHLPPDYVTSDATAAGVSLAYSGKFNLRGLESLWYSPYTHTFTDLVNFYNGYILVNPQYALFVPSSITMKEKLLHDFKAAGLNYADGSKKDPSPLVARPAPTLSAANQPKRASRRLAKKEEDNAAAATEREIAELEKLLERKAVVEQQEEAYMAAINKADISKESVASEPQDEAVDKLPDFVLGHVGKFGISPAKSKTAHYAHRAGVKVFHHCCVLIGELKPQPPRGPARNRTTKEEALLIGETITEAQDDLVEYVAAYFEREPKADSVIAFAAAGPYWRWAAITRDSGDVPPLAWTRNTVFKENAKETRKFHSRFGVRFFTLGTGKSDEELTKISRGYLHPLVGDVEHTGEQPEEQDNNESDEEHEQQE